MFGVSNDGGSSPIFIVHDDGGVIFCWGNWLKGRHFFRCFFGYWFRSRYFNPTDFSSKSIRSPNRLLDHLLRCFYHNRFCGGTSLVITITGTVSPTMSTPSTCSIRNGAISEM